MTIMLFLAREFQIHDVTFSGNKWGKETEINLRVRFLENARFSALLSCTCAWPFFFEFHVASCFRRIVNYSSLEPPPCLSLFILAAPVRTGGATKAARKHSRETRVRIEQCFWRKDCRRVSYNVCTEKEREREREREK